MTVGFRHWRAKLGRGYWHCAGYGWLSLRGIGEGLDGWQQRQLGYPRLQEFSDGVLIWGEDVEVGGESRRAVRQKDMLGMVRVAENFLRISSEE